MEKLFKAYFLVLILFKWYQNMSGWGIGTCLTITPIATDFILILCYLSVIELNKWILRITKTTVTGCLAKTDPNKHFKLSHQNHILFYKVYLTRIRVKLPRQIPVIGTHTRVTITHNNSPRNFFLILPIWKERKGWWYHDSDSVCDSSSSRFIFFLVC